MKDIIKKLSNIISNRIFVIALGILLQLMWIITMVWGFAELSGFFRNFIMIASIVLVLWIVNQRINPSYKLAWAILILAVPLFGVTIYFLFGQSRVAKKIEQKYNITLRQIRRFFKEKEEVHKALEQENLRMANTSKYIRDYGGFPIHTNTQTKYYPVGDDMFIDMINELKKAEHFIFLEYFIISEGRMWSAILEVLEQKVREGVDVRLIYDDMGCVTTLPYHFYKDLQAKGIKCAAFNPLQPILNIVLNNRDHRKIMVIDGHVGFTGGINLADEYINEYMRFGHWKDTGIMLKGDAVWNLTVMFLQMWNVITGVESDYAKYTPQIYHKEPYEKDGYVQPYSDSPLDDEIVGENVYLSVIHSAKKYLYICTPYLIIDNEMMTALCLAAKSGVDVRIMTPGIPDKKIVFLLTQSYYEQLLEAGVKIYEYIPGFLHAKSFVCDDEVAVVGTINLDYRSLYLHFECATWMYKSKAVMEVKEDMVETYDVCHEVTLDFCKEQNIIVRTIQSILRVFAPML